MTEAFLLDFERPIVELGERIAELRARPEHDAVGATELTTLEERHRELEAKVYRNLSRWDRVRLARHPLRPHTSDFIEAIFTDFVELRGDRAFADDPAVVAGFARLGGRAVLVVGTQKGRDVNENVHRNFGMPRPEGYRKARRLFALAERFERPIITLIDTPGAFPGLGAEERAQAEAIASSLQGMSQLRVPVIAVITGEGGSGGALALGVANRVLMLENAVYSVISPEGCASILFRDAGRAAEAALALRPTAHDLAELDVIDEIVGEPLGGAHRDPKCAFATLSEALIRHLGELVLLDQEALVAQRYRRFRGMGVFCG